MAKIVKKLELAWKAFWMATICRIIVRTLSPSSEPDWAKDSCRILFLRPDRIGDAIVSTGFFREIVANAPHVTLDALGSTRNEEILRMDPHLSKIHILDRRAWTRYPRLVRELRARKYDGVIDCMITGPSMTCLLLMLACGARHRIGAEGRGVIDSALTIRVPVNARAIHMVDHLAEFGRVFGIDVDEIDWGPRLEVSPEEIARAMSIWENNGANDARQPYRVLVNVSAGRPSRNWSERRFALVVDHLRKRVGELECIVIGAPGEWDRTERVALLAGARAVNTPSFRDAIALVSTANFLFTPDTSLAHVASAVGTPAVAMYLRGTSKHWSIIGDRSASIEVDSLTLSALPLEPVLEAVDRVVDPRAALA